MMKKLSVLSVLFCLLSSVAHAYVPPSQFIIKSMAHKRMGMKGLRVRSHVLGADAGAHFKELALFDAASRILRCRATDDAGKVLYAMDVRMPSPEGRVRDIAVVPELLLDSRTDILTRILKAFGVPIRSEAELLSMKDEEERRASEATSLKRLNRTAAWVIGPDGKSAMSELWVEKDTFLPVRFSATVEGQPLDYRFSSYKFFREMPYPRQMEIYRVNGKESQLEIKAEVSELAVNPDLSDLKTRLIPGFTTEGDAADGKVKALIETYYRLAR